MKSNPLFVPFLFAGVVLGLGILVQWPLNLGAWFEKIHDKEPLPPRRPLASLDRDLFKPYRFIKADFMPPESVEALGTNEYLRWTLEDPRRAEDDPLRYVSLFVTYYTGGLDLVPHTPDECYFASGYDPATLPETVVRPLETLPEEAREVPLRLVTFEKTGIFGRSRLSVIYTFFCNGRFTADKLDIRFQKIRPASRYAFFSKVELIFGGTASNKPGIRPATPEETLEGAEEVLSVALPRLVESAWPDIEEAGAPRKAPGAEATDR